MAIWELEKAFTFEAAHNLPSHDGKCRRVHGHSWKGKIVVRGNELQQHGPKKGMLLDYADIRAAVTPMLEQYLDHWDLNETTGLENPTSEEIARWIYGYLATVAIVPWLELIYCIEVEETCTSACRYYPV
jgi:6-pyruvoyltetrahydropterin/6-carboxytetrahydropterin synthase